VGRPSCRQTTRYRDRKAALAEPVYGLRHVASREFALARSKDEILENSVVLVVEDEPIIRIETVQMLKDAGYAVVDAPNTDDAIAILEGRQDIHAVFTEIRVTGHLNGMELAHAIAKRWPLVRVVVTSGVPRADDFPADWSYVQKPYDGPQLTGALRALLALRSTVAN